MAQLIDRDSDNDPSSGVPVKEPSLQDVIDNLVNGSNQAASNNSAQHAVDDTVNDTNAVAAKNADRAEDVGQSQQWLDRKKALAMIQSAPRATPQDASADSGQPRRTSIQMPEMNIPVNSQKYGEDNSQENELNARLAAGNPSEATDKLPSSTSSAPKKYDDNIASVEQLKALQDRSNLLHGLAGFQNDSGLAYDIAGIKRPTGVDWSAGAKRFDAMADRLPAQYKEQVDFQKQDPKSAISQTYRDMASKLGMPINDQTSGAEIEKAFPQIVNIKTREDMVEARKEIAKDRLQEMHFRNEMLKSNNEDRAAQRQAKTEADQEKFDTKRYDTYSFKMGLPSSKTVLGQAQNQVFSVNRVDALINGHLNPHDLTDQEVVEVAKGLDRVISGGASTLEGSRSLNPGTMRQWISNQMQKITNTPHGAQAGAFVKRIQYNLQNEKQAAIRQMANSVQTILAGSTDLAERNPARYGKFLRDAQVDPEVAEYLLTGKKPQTLQEQGHALTHAGVNAAQGIPLGQPMQGVGQPSSNNTPFGISQDAIAAELAKRAKGNQGGH